MLVLTRKQGEQIRIGDDVVITVVRTKGKAVRLGIQAPAHVPVLRGEIAKAIAHDQKQAAAGDEEHDDEPWPSVESQGSNRVALMDQPTSTVQLVRLGRSPLREMLAARVV